MKDSRSVKIMTPTSCLIFQSEMNASAVMCSKIPVPQLFIEAKDDDVVSNKQIRENYKVVSNPDSEYFESQGDHGSCFYDATNGHLLALKVTNFLDKVLGINSCSQQEEVKDEINFERSTTLLDKKVDTIIETEE